MGEEGNDDDVDAFIVIFARVLRTICPLYMMVHFDSLLNLKQSIQSVALDDV